MVVSVDGSEWAVFFNPFQYMYLPRCGAVVHCPNTTLRMYLPFEYVITDDIRDMRSPVSFFNRMYNASQEKHTGLAGTVYTHNTKRARLVVRGNQ